VAIKAVLFDMDGVLADTESFYNHRRAAYLAEVLPSYEGPWDFSGSNDVAIWETIVPYDVDLRTHLHEGYNRYRAEHTEDYRVLGNPEAPTVLRALKEAKLLVGIASSSEPAMVERMMEGTRLTEFVDAHVSGCEVKCHKPAPDVYLRCMQLLGVRPEECLVVEDSPTGIVAGVASGAYVVALSQYVAAGTDQSAAHAHIETLGELVALLGL